MQFVMDENDWLDEIAARRYEWTRVGPTSLEAMLRPRSSMPDNHGIRGRRSCPLCIHRYQRHCQLLAVGDGESAYLRTIAQGGGDRSVLAYTRPCDGHVQESGGSSTTDGMKLVDTIPIRSDAIASEQAISYVPASHNDRAALQAVVAELCLNVLQWADSPGDVVIEEDSHHTIVTVQDSGVGIPATMREAFADLSDEEAVARALTPGITSSGDRWRGYGLASTVRLSEREGFSVYLETRAVACWAENGNPTFCSKSGGAVAGTRVQIIYSLDHP